MPWCAEAEGRHHSHASVSEALICGGGRRGRPGSRAGKSAVERGTAPPPILPTAAPTPHDRIGPPAASTETHIFLHELESCTFLIRPRSPKRGYCDADLSSSSGQLGEFQVSAESRRPHLDFTHRPSGETPAPTRRVFRIGPVGLFSARTSPTRRRTYCMR